MLDGKKALAIAQQYVDDSLAGAGAVAGKPCQIQSITPITGGNRITFLWEDNNGVSHTQNLNVLDGAKGDKGDRGEVGETGATGAQGNSGTITVGSVTSGVSPAVTNVGTDTNAIFNFVLAKGDKGEQGEKGEDGQDGKSFEIKAQYPNYQALITAHPTGEAGDAYFVGTDENPDLYIWLTEDAEWFNNGKLAGVKGDKGDTGEAGFSPIASVVKVGSVATITIRDQVGQTTATVSDGTDGENSQYETLPPANATNEGRICQYVGQTSGGLINGHFYQCTDVDGTFYWVEKFGSAMDKDAGGVVRPNDPKLVDGNAVYSAINNALSSVYTPRGELTCAELTASLLIAENVGSVYEMSDAGTTTNLFLQGAGETISIGDNVGIIQTAPNNYMFNLMGNAFDLHDYQKKDLASPITVGGVSQTTVEGALGGLNGLVPSEASSSNKLVSDSDVPKKGLKTRGHCSDYDTCIEAGIYSTDTTTLGTRPSGYSGYGVLVVYGNNPETPSGGSQWIIQEWQPISDSRAHKFIRQCVNPNTTTPSANQWSDWQELTPTSSVTSGSTAPITSGGVYSALLPIRFVEVSTEAQMRALYSSKESTQYVRLKADITVNGITIPTGTEGIFFACTADRHFIGQYYNGKIYSWFMNSNNTNSIVVLPS